MHFKLLVILFDELFFFPIFAASVNACKNYLIIYFFFKHSGRHQSMTLFVFILKLLQKILKKIVFFPIYQL